jgi:tetratricopeptide (TPR) repeat protein
MTPVMSVRKALLLAIVLLAAIHVPHFFSDVEDAYISYRYAENLAAGQGLVFNPGERVEGYTNFLWVVLLAVCRILGATVPTAARWLGLFLTLGVVVLAADLGRRLDAGFWWSGLPAAFLLAANPGVAAWAGSGMEVALFSFLAVLTVDLWTVERESARLPWRWPLAACLAGMARPEGVLLFLIALGAWCLFPLAPSSSLGRRGLTPLAAFLALGTPYFLWRWSYYGALLPNTFAAKSGLDSLVVKHGLLSLFEFLIFAGGAVLWVGALLAFGSRNPAILLLLFQSALFTLYVVLIGGDAYPYSRFFVPVAALLAPAAEIGLRRAWMILARRMALGTRPAAILAGILFVFLGAGEAISSFRGPQLREFRFGEEINGRRAMIAAWLRANLPGDALVALNPAGVIPYFSRLRVLDQIGLTDAHIARAGKRFTNAILYGHNRYDSKYVLSRRPDILVLGSADLLEIDPLLANLRRTGPTSFEAIAPAVARDFFAFPGDEETWKDPIFRRLYTPRIVSLGGRYFYFFQLDPQATRLQEKIDSGASTAGDRAELDRILASKTREAPAQEEAGSTPQVQPIGSPALSQTLKRIASLLERGDQSAAERELLQALRESPKETLLFFNLGVVYERTTRLDEAAAAYEKAVTLRPDFADAWVNLGTVRARQGDLKRARESWERAVVLDPNSPAWENLHRLSAQGH